MLAAELERPSGIDVQTLLTDVQESARRTRASARYQVDEQCTFTGPGMQTKKGSDDSTTGIGISRTSAKNRRHMLGADILVEADLVDRITIDDEAFEPRIARPIKCRRKSLAIAKPIVWLRYGCG